MFYSNGPSALTDCCDLFKKKLEQVNLERVKEMQHHQEKVYACALYVGVGLSMLFLIHSYHSLLF